MGAKVPRRSADLYELAQRENIPLGGIPILRYCLKIEKKPYWLITLFVYCLYRLGFKGSTDQKPWQNNLLTMRRYFELLNMHSLLDVNKQNRSP